MPMQKEEETCTGHQFQSLYFIEIMRLQRKIVAELF